MKFRSFRVLAVTDVDIKTLTTSAYCYCRPSTRIWMDTNGLENPNETNILIARYTSPISDKTTHDSYGNVMVESEFTYDDGDYVGTFSMANNNFYRIPKFVPKNESLVVIEGISSL